MNNKTKARLLKSRGILKKVSSGIPLFLGAAGLASSIGLFVSGLVFLSKGYKEFKQTEYYQEMYDNELQVAQNQYDAGLLNIKQLEETKEYLESDEYVGKLINESGDSGLECKKIIDKSKALGIASIPCLVLGLSNIFLCLSSIPEKLSVSGDADLREADFLKNNVGFSPNPHTSKKDKTEEKIVLEEDEDVLPDIEETYYQN